MSYFLCHNFTLLFTTIKIGFIDNFRAAALPVTFRAMEGPLRIDPRITRFVLPIGCNINMDGTALFVAVASVFVCQMNNMHLGFAQLATIL